MITSAQVRPTLWGCLASGAFLMLLGLGIVISWSMSSSGPSGMAGTAVVIVPIILGALTVAIGAVLAVWSWRKAARQTVAD